MSTDLVCPNTQRSCERNCWRRCAPTEKTRTREAYLRSRFDDQYEVPEVADESWRSVETANLHAMFGRSEWVLIAISDGRVTEGMPFFMDDGKALWIAARGSNCADPRHPTDMLAATVTHWQPLPQHPEHILQKEST